MDAYWGTSMELVSGQSKLNLYDPSWVIHTKSEERAPAKLGPQAGAHQSMICNGCIVRGQVVRSVLSPGVYVSPGAVVRDSVLMNDTWIGPGAVVDRCIVDKNVVVGAGTQLGWGDDYRHAQRSSTRIASTPARPSSARGRACRAASASGATW